MPASTEQALARLLACLAGELDHAVELRQRLHAQPELAHAEHETSRTIAAALPVDCARAAGTGLIARVGGQDGEQAVAVRAELDGLPIEEQSDAPFRAHGRAMHACGHDVHMAALVALTRSAHAIADELPAPLLAIFQPSEEAYPSGARKMLEEGLGSSPIGSVVAAHIHPDVPWGEVALDAGAVNAASDSVLITVEGEPSHGAYPHRGRDPVLALAHIVVALHAQAARRIDPHGPSTLNVGVLEGADAANVIPARARAEVALRAHRQEDRLELRRVVEEVVGGVAAAHGCRARIELTVGEPALENDARIVQGARALLAQAGLRTAAPMRSCGSDDFAYFGERWPIAMAFVGLDGAPGFQTRPLHHPRLLPPDAAVAALARTQAVLYVAAASAREP